MAWPKEARAAELQRLAPSAIASLEGAGFKVERYEPYDLNTGLIVVLRHPELDKLTLTDGEFARL